MKIIWGRNSEEIEKNASKLLKAMEQTEMNYPSHATPRGIAIHAVRYPNTCDECGETFWANEQYATHKGCNGQKKEVGF